MHHRAVSCSNHFNTLAAINRMKNIFNDAHDSLLEKPEVFILPQNTSVLRHKKGSRRQSLCNSRNFGRMCGYWALNAVCSQVFLFCIIFFHWFISYRPGGKL